MLKINKEYSDYTDETDENYPEGKAINTSSAESVDGTPVLASFLNNIIGAFQGMYKKAFGNTKGINGIEDNVNQSQFVDAIEKYTQDKVKEHADKRGLVDGIHGATSSALGGQIVSRDALGSAEFSVPLSNTAAARRGDIYDLTLGVLCETPESEFSKEIPSSSYPGFTLQNGAIVRILFQFGASKETVLLEETEKLTLNVCETGAKKIFVKFNGVVKEIDRYEIEENTVYFQAFTDMNLIYIETLDEGNGGWLIMNNPVIISNKNEITYADGSIVYNKQTVDSNLKSALDTKANCYYLVNPINVKIPKKNRYGDVLLFGGWLTTGGLFNGVAQANNNSIMVDGNLGFAITIEDGNYIVNKTGSGNLYLYIIN